MTTTIAPKPQAPTPSPVEELTRLLVRAAEEPPKLSKFVRRALAGLSPADRSDVLQSAIAWCWQRRHGWDLITAKPVGIWFLGVVKNMKHQLLRRWAEDAAVEYLGEDDVPQGDTTLARVESLEAAEKLAAALPLAYRRVVQLDAEGYSREEMVELGVPRRTVNDARARVRQLRRLMPDPHDEHKVGRPTPPAPMSDDLEDGELSPIDMAIEDLGAMPLHGPDTKEHELPDEARELLPRVEDPDVRAAIERTEARRTEIG